MFASIGDLRAHVRAIPPGWGGTLATVREMARLAARDAVHPDIVFLARSLVRHLPARDHAAECQVLLEYVHRNIRYIYDPAGAEWVQTPRATLVAGQGDCDCMGALYASLVLAIGLMAGFRTVKADAAKPTEYSHVFNIVSWPGLNRWLPADPSDQRHLSLGQTPEVGHRVFERTDWQIDAETGRVRVIGTERPAASAPVAAAPSGPQFRMPWATPARAAGGGSLAGFVRRVLGGGF